MISCGMPAYLPEAELTHAFGDGSMLMKKFKGEGHFSDYYGFMDRYTDRMIYAAFDKDEATDIICWLRDTAMEEIEE